MRNIPEGYKREKNSIIPLEWNYVKIDSILARVKNKVEVNSKERYQQIGIRSHGKGLFYKEPVTGEELGNKSVFWLLKDCFIVNIVFAWEQAVGRTTENEIGMICSHRFPMYRPIDNKVDIDYLVYLFKTPYGKKVLELASPGGAGRNKTLGQKEFANSEILIPNLIEEQKKIIKILSTWDSAIEKQEKVIEKKKMLKKGLMQRILSGKVRFSEFNEKWTFSTLGEIGEFKTSSVDKKIDSNNEYINLLNYMDVYKNNIINSTIKFMKVTANNNQIINNLLKVGDVLFTPSSETPTDIGHSAVVVEEIENLLHSYHLVRYRLNIDMDLMFKAFIFNNDNILRQFSIKSTGSTRFTLSIKDFQETQITYPSNLIEQRKIAQILLTSDKEIELLQKELEALKLQKKGLMQRLLTGEVRVKL